MENIGVKIVVIGGGTGSFTLLSELKNYTHNLTALVSMADDGGSTGVLRDELGVLPAGDVRQCLVALSNSPKVRDLFNYRFDNGRLKGHAFGNLFMAALEKMTGSFGEAVETASQVLNIRGHVEPITLDNVSLVMRREDGSETKGQFESTYIDLEEGEKPFLTLDPVAHLNPAAQKAILEADMVVIAPGHLYGSLAPALIVSGLTRTLRESKAKKVYVCNLVTKPEQTKGFTVADFASEIERFAGVPLDFVLYNNHKPPEELIKKYAHDGEFIVDWDEKALEKKHYKAVGKKFIADMIWQNTNESSDPIASKRSLIRHDAERVARELMRIYFT